MLHESFYLLLLAVLHLPTQLRNAIFVYRFARRIWLRSHAPTTH
jgi:hypothetical protein